MINDIWQYEYLVCSVVVLLSQFGKGMEHRLRHFDFFLIFRPQAATYNFYFNGRYHQIFT